MKPSDIDLLSSIMPLTDTFGRSEAEAMAACMIAVLAAGDDEWKPTTFTELAGILSFDPPPAWLTNPFCHPSPCELCSRGYARIISVGDVRAIEFTAWGLAALKASQWNTAGGE